MSSEAQKADLSSLRINRSASAPSESGGSKKKVILFSSIGAVVLVVAAFIIFGGGVASTEQVEIVTVSLTYPSQANTVLTASGYVVAQRKAAVASKGTGRLEYLGVIEGDRVTKGSIIGRLESSDVDAALGQARANLGVAKAGVDQAKAELDDATANYQREKSLFEKNLASEADYDPANARYKKAIAGVTSAEASLNAAEATVRAAEVQVEYTNIRAPFDGTVLTKDADVGDVITPFGAASGSRGDIVTLADMNSLEVEADVSESNISKVYTGQPCEITLDAIPDKRYHGTVHKIVPTADRAKATVLTKIQFLDRDDLVLPEMSAKAIFLSKETDKPTENSTPKISVPVSAVATRDGKKVAFLVRDESVVATPVVVGELMGSSMEIKEGLAVGDKVVNHPSAKLSSGTKIAQAK
ncbi:MAG TPA: efflux RND transporter periplasmic adaptor subunit [Bacteroidota bacterium]|nr:efflux RND transporter periplasmic adaptor subunit [Bacteroidota bacterium]